MASVKDWDKHGHGGPMGGHGHSDPRGGGVDLNVGDALGHGQKGVLPIIFMKDNSWSMFNEGGGARAGALNDAMPRSLDALKRFSETNAYAEIAVRELNFDKGVRWCGSLLRIEDYGTSWQYTKLVEETCGTSTDLGAAFKLLARDLTPQNLGTGGFPPVIILLTDGEPTDSWEAGLAEFNASKFGRKPEYTVRYAINIVDANRAVLAAFTGDDAMVVECDAIELAIQLPNAVVSLSRQASRRGSIGAGLGGKVASTPILPPPNLTKAGGRNSIGATRQSKVIPQANQNRKPAGTLFQ